MPLGREVFWESILEGSGYLMVSTPGYNPLNRDGPPVLWVCKAKPKQTQDLEGRFLEGSRGTFHFHLSRDPSFQEPSKTRGKRIRFLKRTLNQPLEGCPWFVNFKAEPKETQGSTSNNDTSIGTLAVFVFRHVHSFASHKLSFGRGLWSSEAASKMICHVG